MDRIPLSGGPSAAPTERPQSSLEGIKSQLEDLIQQAEHIEGKLESFIGRVAGSNPKPPSDPKGQPAAVPRGMIEEINNRLDRLRILNGLIGDLISRMDTVG